MLKKANPVTVINYIAGNIHELYTFYHDATEQTLDLTDYRYIGNAPNNYVNFNDELWRIIGIFKVEDDDGNLEERVKIVRNESLGSKVWNSSKVNEWVSSTMQIYLNDDYDMSDYSLSFIKNVKYYLGGLTSYSDCDGEGYYKSERLNPTQSSRNYFWIGKVGLIYTSDYIYTYSLGVDDICYNTPGMCKTDNNGVPTSGWLYIPWVVQWTISPFVRTSNVAHNILGPGNINNSLSTDGAHGARPVVYLKPNVKITSGDGSIDNPYNLSL